MDFYGYYLFSRLLQFSDKHKQALCYVTYIGLGISLLGETITIIAYLLLMWVENLKKKNYLAVTFKPMQEFRLTIFAWVSCGLK